MARGWGRIVNVTSLTVLGAVERTAYASARAALVSFCRSWALELAITVNAMSSGPIETDLFRADNPPGSEGERRYLTDMPMKRFRQPNEIAPPLPSSFRTPGSSPAKRFTLMVEPSLEKPRSDYTHQWRSS
jgi:NAD(P)-dependent dehydrogenase (short-subunit alcohol dehydrogenase family)